MGYTNKTFTCMGKALPWSSETWPASRTTTQHHTGYLLCRIFWKTVQIQVTVCSTTLASKITTRKGRYCRGPYFSRNLCFRRVTVCELRQGTTHFTPPPNHIQSSHSSWSDMQHRGDQAPRTTAGETCSFNCCISLCIHSYDSVWRRWGEHLRLAITPPIKGAW